MLVEEGVGEKTVQRYSLSHQQRLHPHRVRLRDDLLQLWHSFHFKRVLIGRDWRLDQGFRNDQHTIFIALFQSFSAPSMSLFLSTKVAPSSSKASIRSCLPTRSLWLIKCSTM